MSNLVSVNTNGLVPFFAREQLLDNSLDDKTEVSFSFNPIGKIPKYSNQMKCSSVMKIEHILDVNADAINYANSLKLIGCNTEAVEWLASDNLGRSISSITTGNGSSKTFTLHVSKSGFRKTMTHLSCKPLRRHQCNICLKTFSRPSSLKAHSYTHTGEKPYVCQTAECGMRFNVFSNLKRHNKKCKTY